MPRASAAHHGVLGLPPLLSLAAERGLDGERLLREAGIAAGLLADPTATVPVAKVHALSQLLLERRRDFTLGLHAGRHYHPSTFGLLGAVAAIAPTAREVVRLFVEHVHLTFTFFLVELVETGDGPARLVFVDDRDLGSLHRFYLDRDLAFVYELAKQLWPEQHRHLLRAVELDYPEPPEAERYRRRFPCPVRFGSPEAAVVIDFARDQPRAAANPLGIKLLEEHLRSFAGRAPGGDDLTERVRREIASSVAIRRRLPDVDGIATALGLSERALRRRLRAEGTSFRALADEVIALLAKRYLRDSDLSVASVAERLGYSESASFVRAFRRVTRTTPESFRSRPPPSR